MPKAKAYWKGHPIYDIGDYCNGWALIAFEANWYESPLTGTGACWVDMNDIVLEAA